MNDTKFKQILNKVSVWHYSYLNRAKHNKTDLTEDNGFPVIKELRCRVGCPKCNADTNTPVFTYSKITGKWRGKCSVCKGKC